MVLSIEAKLWIFCGNCFVFFTSFVQVRTKPKEFSTILIRITSNAQGASAITTKKALFPAKSASFFTNFYNFSHQLCLSSGNGTTVQNCLSHCKTGIYVPKLLIPDIYLQMLQILGNCREITRIHPIYPSRRGLCYEVRLSACKTECRKSIILCSE